MEVGSVGLAVVGELLRVGRQGGDDVHVGTVSVTNFLFCASGVRCCPQWFYWAVRGLYGRVARQHTLVHGLRGA